MNPDPQQGHVYKLTLPFCGEQTLVVRREHDERYWLVCYIDNIAKPRHKTITTLAKAVLKLWLRRGWATFQKAT